MMQSVKQWLAYTLTNTQTRLVLFLTVSVCVIISGVSLTSYYTSKSVLQSELSEPQHQMLQISMNFIDEYIEKTDQIAVTVALHPNVYTFLTSENQNSYDNVSKIYEFFDTLIANTSYIDSIYVHDLARGSFVATPQGYSSSRVTFVDSQWVSVADEFGDAKMLVRKRSVPSGAGVRNSGTELTLFRKILIQGEFRGIVAINLKEEELFAKLHPPHRSGLERARFIVDLDGETLYSVAGGGFDPETVRAAPQHSEGEEIGEFRYNGASYLVNRLESPLTGWTYVSYVSQDSLLAQSKHVRNVVLSVSAAALLLGIAAIAYIQSVAFRPIRRMQRLFNQNDRDPNRSPDDLLHLERLTSELLSDHAQLAQLIRQTMPEASSKFLYDVYMGNVHSKRELKEKWSSYFHGWTDAPLTFAVLSIDRYEAWSRRYPTADHSLLKFALANVIAELLASEWRVSCADFGKDKLAVLLQPTRGGSGAPQVEAFADAIDVVRRMLGFSVSLGVSAPFADPGGLRQAMLEAENALGYRLFRGYGSVTFFDEVLDHELAPAAAKEPWIDDLAAAIESGDESRALQAVARMAHELRETKYYPSAALKLLRGAADRLRRIEQRGEADAEETDSLEEVDTLSLEEIAQRFAGRASASSARIRGLMERKDYALCQNMIEFMKGRLGEPIGIQEIADAVGVSVSLASQLFKQEMDDTIYGYFTKLRMDRAGELLVETDEKISDIAAKVGYQHENSFIRVFRKYKNITPGKYREMMKYKLEAAHETTAASELRGRDYNVESKGNRLAP
ncbi:helix-turn-helix domain-containing protein [Paenibacillus sp.]|uniref:helix-turn-helix domain-containing protein n=1 Tax=Paenibacillus sp. TaxID=58172 RepID=UPI002D609A8D|nr:helix-turn-helix domain-containing protein [Paenibacillus sp.]HZG87817.1 helix-turn-helix domain-containing protein [Paenibacillus sp.]